MKLKRLLCVLLSVLLLSSLMTACGDDGDADGIVIAALFYDLANPVWAATGEAMIEYAMEEYGVELMLLGAENNASIQVSQMENVIEAGVDAIIVGGVDDNALVDVIQRAKDAGITVIGYGTEPPGAHALYGVDNYNVGFEAGRRAAMWINEMLDGEAEVAVLRFDEMEVLIERGDGIEDALAQYAPNATIVARAHAADPVTGMSVTENILTEHPNVKVIVCIGDGGGIGANNAVKAAGLATDQFGIFSVDATEEAVRAIIAGDPLRMSIGLGFYMERAIQVIDLTMDVLEGRDFPPMVYTPVFAVDWNNAEQYAIDAGWD